MSESQATNDAARTETEALSRGNEKLRTVVIRTLTQLYADAGFKSTNTAIEEYLGQDCVHFYQGIPHGDQCEISGLTRNPEVTVHELDSATPRMTISLSCKPTDDPRLTLGYNHDVQISRQLDPKFAQHLRDMTQEARRDWRAKWTSGPKSRVSSPEPEEETDSSDSTDLTDLTDLTSEEDEENPA